MVQDREKPGEAGQASTLPNAPTPKASIAQRLKLPPNCRDVTAERGGAAVSISGVQKPMPGPSRGAFSGESLKFIRNQTGRTRT